MRRFLVDLRQESSLANTLEHYSLSMYLRKLKKPNGRVYLSIVQSYRSAEGKPRSKTIRSLGYLDDLERYYADPIAHFQQVIDGMNAGNLEGDAPVSITFSQHAKIPYGAGDIIEAGSAIVFSVLHHDLDIGQMLAALYADEGRTGDLEQALELLVWNRIAHERPIANAWNLRTVLYGMHDLPQESIYKSVDALGANHSECRKRAGDALRRNHQVGSGSYAYCFIVNYYVEGSRFSQPDYDKLWQNRTNPIVQLAIMVDRSGIPIDYSFFDTSLSNPLSSFPALQELGYRHPNVRLIVVSDRAIGSSNYELAYLSDLGYGFVLPQSLRKGTRGSREWVLDAEGYIPFGEDGSRHKQRMDVRLAETFDVRKRPRSLAVKETALWLREEFESTRFNRYRIVRRTENAYSNGAPSEGSVKPMRAKYGSGNAKPGDIGDYVWQVYWDKIATDESMDGYMNIVTSELDLSSPEIIGLYQGLHSIRAFYAPMPGEWSACPDWISRTHYIQAHFLLCHLAACVVQLLHERAGRFFPDDSVRSTLVRLTGVEVSPGQFFFSFRSHLSDKLGEIAGIDLSRPLVGVASLARMVQSIRNERKRP